MTDEAWEKHNQWIMHNSISGRLMVATVSLCLLFPAVTAASQVADYQFAGNLQSSIGGAPALTLIGEGHTFESTTIGENAATVLTIPAFGGVALSPTSGIIPSDQYSISIVMELDQVDWWEKLIDFSNGDSDAGLYLFNFTGLAGVSEASLRFAGGFETETDALFRRDVWHEVTITRESTSKVVIVYLDGSEIFRFVDEAERAVIDPNQTLRFVVDDRETSGVEMSPGTISRIRVWDSVIIPEAWTPVGQAVPCPEPAPCPSPSGTPIPASERAALMAIYDATAGDCWTNNTGWMCNVGTECSWYGVSCSAGHVTGIDLKGNHLVGLLPAEVGNLPELRTLSLDGEVEGPIPSTLAGLSNLERLDLANTEISGSIPEWIGSLTNLDHLSLHSTNVTGQIPDEIGLLTKLRYLDLGDNRLSGVIPDSIGELEALEFLLIDGSGLTGGLPESIGNLRNLVVINVTGSLDGSVGRLSGPLPQSIGNLTKLEELTIWFNLFSGPIPESIGNMVNLRILTAGGGNQFSGPIPEGFWALPRLEVIGLEFNGGLTGEISPMIGNMTNLRSLNLSFNQMTGTIPSEIGSLTNLNVLQLGGNGFTGAIPETIGNLTSLVDLTLSENDLTGPLPLGIAQLANLEYLRLLGNRLEGTIPASYGNLSKLRILDLRANQLSGTIPAELGSLPTLHTLDLTSNLLSGSLPVELVNLPDIFAIRAGKNRLVGELPSTWLGSKAAQIDLSFNALTAAPDVAAFLEGKGGFARFQTVAPTDVKVDDISAFSASLSWTPIAYQFDPGGYQVLVATNPGGPYALTVTTENKSASSVLVTGLQPTTTYYFVVRSVTFPYGGGIYYQLNTNFSAFSDEISATTTVATATSPEVIVTSVPSALVQVPGQGGATTSFVLTNIGGTSTSVTLTQSGAFFTQEPSSFSLEPGATQAVLLTGLPSSEGDYFGESIPSGVGVPSGLSVPVTLSSGTAPEGTIRVVAETNRISLVAPESQNPSGQIFFRNDGDTTFVGVASADVEFLQPQQGIITIAPGLSVPVSVTSDRTKRPDSGSLNGTQVGSVSLFSLPGLNAKARTPFDGAGPAVSLVTVVDTVKPDTKAGEIPALVEGEVALLIPSVGHIVGSVGEFVSDVSILNARGSDAVSDIDLYYTTAGGTGATTADLNPIGSGASVSLADVVKTVFEGQQEVGTLQIRSRDADGLSVSANVFNATDPRGFFGTSIPVFRSDRGVASGGEIFLTGLRKDETGHTNLYIQEVGGADSSVRIDFFEPGGTIVGSTEAVVRRFGMTSIQNPLSPGTVMVRITNTGAGKVVAYATPVDRSSGDTWAVADWALLYGFDPNEKLVIPVGGAVRGANDTDFRTDIAISNRCAEQVPLFVDSESRCPSATMRARLRFVPASGPVVEKQIEVGLLETLVLNDVIRDFLGIETDTIGSIEIEPESDLVAATSRTYTLVGGTAATFGSTVPALGISRTIRPGQSLRIGGLSDSTRATIQDGTPATLRTNFGLVEVADEALEVRVSVYFNDPRALAAGRPIGTRVFSLEPRGFQNVNNMVEAVVGPARESLYGDLSGIMVQFDVISETGALLVYTSSIDNGTGDSILRTE